MKDIRSQHIVSIIALSLLFCACLPAEAFANSLSVDPSITTIFNSNFPVTRTISLTNLSDQTEYIRSQIVAIKQDTNGQALFIANSQTDPQTSLLLKDVALSQTSLTLLPQEAKQLQITIGTPTSQVLNRDYYFSILFISKDTYSLPSSGNQVKATLLQEPVIASLFLLSPAPTKKNSLDVELIDHTPFWSTLLSPQVSLENKSASLAQMTIHLTVTDFLGGKFIDLYRSNTYLFAHTSRVISLGKASLPISFFGPAIVSVSIRDSHSGTFIQRTQRILIIPITFWAVLLLCLILIILFIKRVRTRLAKQRDL